MRQIMEVLNDMAVTDVMKEDSNGHG